MLPVTISVTTPAGTGIHLYLHLKQVPKVFVLVTMLFSLQMHTGKLVPKPVPAGVVTGVESLESILRKCPFFRYSKLKKSKTYL